MIRATTSLLLVAGLLAVAVAAEAQQATKVYRIGIVSPLASPPEPPQVVAFREGLRERGYIEGKNAVVEVRYSEGRAERMPALIAELLKMKVDVLVAGSTEGALAAKKATMNVPVVFAGVTDPVATGVVASLARPGGNITGATFGVGGAGFGGKWLELLKEAVPGIARVAVVWNPADSASPQLLGEIESAAKALKVRIETFEAANDAALATALAAVNASGAQGLIVPSSPLFAANRARLAKFAAEQRLPAIYFFDLFPEAGGLMSYGGSPVESYRKAATYVDKILKGAMPADLPIEQPTKIELVINLQAAKAIGLKIPKGLLLKADRVIE